MYKKLTLSALSLIYISLTATSAIANPTAEAYEAKGEYELAVFQYKLDELSEQDNPRLFNKIGNLLYRLGKYNEAISYFNKAIKVDRGDSIYHYNIGMSYVKLSKDNEAYKEFKKAISMNPNQEKYHHKLGNLLYAHKRYQDAISEYNTILKLNTSYHQAYHNLGLAYNNLEKYKESVFYFKKYLQLKPNDTEVINLLKKVSAKVNDSSDDLIDTPSNSDPFNNMPTYNNGNNTSNDPFSDSPTPMNNKSDDMGFSAFSDKTDTKSSSTKSDSVD